MGFLRWLTPQNPVFAAVLSQVLPATPVSSSRSSLLGHNNGPSGMDC